MSSDGNDAVARQWYDDVLNGHNLDRIDDLCTPDFKDYSPHVPPGSGREGIKQLLGQYFATFPDMHVAVEDTIADDDSLAVRITAQGTHQGTFMGMPATGKPVMIAAIDILRFEDGKIAEHLWEVDLLALLGQLGGMPGHP